MSAEKAEDDDDEEEEFTLTATGQEIKKLVKKGDKEGAYESDGDDFDNPYASVCPLHRSTSGIPLITQFDHSRSMKMTNQPTIEIQTHLLVPLHLHLDPLPTVPVLQAHIVAPVKMEDPLPIGNQPPTLEQGHAADLLQSQVQQQ